MLVTAIDRQQILQSLVKALQDHFKESIPLQNIIKVATNIESACYDQFSTDKGEYMKKVKMRVDQVVQKATSLQQKPIPPASTRIPTATATPSTSAVIPTPAQSIPQKVHQQSATMQNQYRPTQVQANPLQSFMQTNITSTSVMPTAPPLMTQFKQNPSFSDQQNHIDVQIKQKREPLVDLTRVKLDYTKNVVIITSGNEMSLQNNLSSQIKSQIQQCLGDVYDKLLRCKRFLELKDKQSTLFSKCQINFNKLTQIFVILCNQYELAQADIYFMNFQYTTQLVNAFLSLFQILDNYLRDQIEKKRQLKLQQAQQQQQLNELNQQQDVNFDDYINDGNGVSNSATQSLPSVASSTSSSKQSISSKRQREETLIQNINEQNDDGLSSNAQSTKDVAISDYSSVDSTSVPQQIKQIEGSSLQNDQDTTQYKGQAATKKAKVQILNGIQPPSYKDQVKNKIEATEEMFKIYDQDLFAQVDINFLLKLVSSQQ